MKTASVHQCNESSEIMSVLNAISGFLKYLYWANLYGAAVFWTLIIMEREKETQRPIDTADGSRDVDLDNN